MQTTSVWRWSCQGDRPEPNSDERGKTDGDHPGVGRFSGENVRARTMFEEERQTRGKGGAQGRLDEAEADERLVALVPAPVPAVASPADRRQPRRSLTHLSAPSPPRLRPASSPGRPSIVETVIALSFWQDVQEKVGTQKETRTGGGSDAGGTVAGSPALLPVLSPSLFPPPPPPLSPSPPSKPSASAGPAPFPPAPPAVGEVAALSPPSPLHPSAFFTTSMVQTLVGHSEAVSTALPPILSSPPTPPRSLRSPSSPLVLPRHFSGQPLESLKQLL